MRDFTGSERMNRRSFMAAAAASLAAPAVLGAQGAAPAKEGPVLRIGVIGGRFGAQFYWHEHPRCRVSAVCDILDEPLEDLKRTYRCDRGYKDWREMLKDREVDAVAVFTPAPLHVEMAVASLKAGKHVISAVPAGMDEPECAALLEAVKSTGLTYMMAETSFYRREIIACREWAEQKKFGQIIYSEAEYHHDGLEPLMFEPDGRPTWRYGFPPMHYPTHCTGMIVPVTGERLTEVTSFGWGDDNEVLRTNVYKNPFWSETAMFKTSGGHASRVSVFWHVASGGVERGQFLGTQMSYYMPRPEAEDQPGVQALRTGEKMVRNRYTESRIEMQPCPVPNRWELLPEPLRHDSGHGGSHTFITHEFVDAVLSGRRPTVDVHEAIAYTLPGIVAHQSALKGGVIMKIPDYGRA